VANELIASTGKVTELRVIRMGGKHGPPQDQIDVEVVVKLDSEPSRSMGFQLRDDENRPVRQGMLDLLRTAFEIRCQTRLEYSIDLGRQKERYHRSCDLVEIASRSSSRSLGGSIATVGLRSGGVAEQFFYGGALASAGLFSGVNSLLKSYNQLIMLL
jgi:hypothetical protein